MKIALVSAHGALEEQLGKEVCISKFKSICYQIIEDISIRHGAHPHFNATFPTFNHQAQRKDMVMP